MLKSSVHHVRQWYAASENGPVVYVSGGNLFSTGVSVSAAQSQ